MNQSFNIPSGKFAGEDAAAKLRAEKREALLKGQKVELGNGQFAPKGKLAGQDAAAKLREEKRKALLEGKKVELGNGQFAPKGKLAAQWYEKDPQLLINEKLSMARFYPQFTLEQCEDGRICWIGALNVGIYESKFKIPREYHVMAVYDNNHPNQRMGSSVRVYLIMPDVDELIAECKFLPHHLLRDDVGNTYLCTNEAGDQLIGTTITTAASVLGWAQKWLIAYELVLTGDMSIADFNRPGGI